MVSDKRGAGILLALIAAVYSLNVAEAQQCYGSGRVPQELNNSISFYPNTESGFQIFTDLRIPCDGDLVQWTFLPLIGYVLQLHLAVFRPLANDEYEIIGDTYIDNVRVTQDVNVGYTSWYTHTLRRPIPVRTGDVLGMYYDYYRTRQPYLAIPSRSLEVGGHRVDVGFTYVFPYDTVGQLLTTSNTVNVKSAIAQFRIPALSATVDYYTEPLPGEPVLEPLITGSTPDPSCYARETAVPADIDMNDQYRFVEGGLQIFSDLEVPCDGVITEWRFKPQFAYILQLHLGVFRRVNTTHYRKIASTFIDRVKLESYIYGSGGWTAYPVQPPIWTRKGDVLGMYYNGFTGTSRHLTILSKVVADSPMVRPTYVVVMTAEQLAAEGGLVEVGASFKRSRIPALQAALSVLPATTAPPTPPPVCNYPSLVPPMVDEEATYPLAEAGLQLFQHLEMPCEGKLVEWRFQPRFAFVLQLHLAIFRRYANGNFLKIKDTYIDNYRVPNYVIDESHWTTYTLVDPIEVQEGDIVGLYYDLYQTVNNYLSIPSKEVGSMDGMVDPTLVFLKDASSLLASDNVVNEIDAVERYRIPALQARFVPRVPSPNFPQVPPAECQVGPRQVPAIPDQNSDYPIADARLHIFTELRFDCSGRLIEWAMLPRFGYVFQLHLAVFRPLSSHNLYEKIGDTYLERAKVNSDIRSPGNWVSFPLSDPIDVLKGDVVGIYHDFTTNDFPYLPVGMREDRNVDETYILPLSARGIEGLGNIVNITNATVAHLMPAVAATVAVVDTATQGPVAPPPVSKPLPVYIGGMASEAPATAPPTPARQPSVTVWQSVGGRQQVPMLPGIVASGGTVRRCFTDFRASVCPATMRSSRAYFDSTLRICRAFQGCPPASPDENNFASTAECSSTCGAWDPSVDCLQNPTALEQCQRTTTRYYYNKYRQACMTFEGCSLGGRRGNNFDTLEQCNLCRGPAQLVAASAQSLPRAILDPFSSE